MTKLQLTAEINRLTDEITHLQNCCNVYRAQVKSYSNLGDECESLRSKIQDMKNLLVQYEQTLGITNDWGKMTYIITNYSCKYNTAAPHHICFELDVYPAPIKGDGEDGE